MVAARWNRAPKRCTVPTNRPERIQIESPAARPGASVSTRQSGRAALFHRGLDAGEGGVQLRAETRDHGDDRNRDAGGNQAVLDGGCTRLVLHETRKQLLHGHGLSVSRSWP